MPRRKRRKPAAPSKASHAYDMAGPTPERLAKAKEDEVEVVTPDESEHWRAMRLTDAHVLEYLRSRSCISSGQYEAGHRFYSDWYHAGLAASGVIDPGRVIVDCSSSEHASDRKLTALHQWQRAVQAVGMIHSTILVDILLMEERLEDWGRRRRGQASVKLARHAAITAISLALEALDHHYHPPRRDRTRSSHAPGYRPTIIRPESDAEG
jgi:hypothetical protein